MQNPHGSPCPIPWEMNGARFGIPSLLGARIFIAFCLLDCQELIECEPTTETLSSPLLYNCLGQFLLLPGAAEGKSLGALQKHHADARAPPLNQRQVERSLKWSLNHRLLCCWQNDQTCRAASGITHGSTSANLSVGRGGAAAFSRWLAHQRPLDPMCVLKLGWAKCLIVGTVSQANSLAISVAVCTAHSAIPILRTDSGIQFQVQN